MALGIDVHGELPGELQEEEGDVILQSTWCKWITCGRQIGGWGAQCGDVCLLQVGILSLFALWAFPPPPPQSPWADFSFSILATCGFNYPERLCGSVFRERLRIITVKCVWSPLAFPFEMEITALVSSSGPQVIVPPVPCLLRQTPSPSTTRES